MKVEKKNSATKKKEKLNDNHKKRKNQNSSKSLPNEDAVITAELLQKLEVESDSGSDNDKELSNSDNYAKENNRSLADESYSPVPLELAGGCDSSDDEGLVSAAEKDKLNDHAQESENGSHDSREVLEESDSSEDEVAPRNRIGDVPIEWYRDEKHIGYDITGKKILKKERQDKLESFLASADDSKNWRKLYDEVNDEEIELTKEEIRKVRSLLQGRAPHSGFNEYEPYVDWFKWEDSKFPLSNAPEPKRRFIRSKWEDKKVARLVRAIRKGLIKFDEPKEEPRFYPIWGDDSISAEKTAHLTYIPPPKPKVPGHEESHNPPLEYIPTQEEINSYQLLPEEDRPKLIPRRFTSMRSIPSYGSAVNDAFMRNMDLLLGYRKHKKRINIDPESLKPKLPSRKDLKPYPENCYLEYRGHKDAVVSISTEPSGEWIASGSLDGSVRIWEVRNGRCRKVWEFDEAIKYVAWNPLPELPILAVAVGPDVVLLNTGLGDEEVQAKIEELLHLNTPAPSNDSDRAPVVTWLQDDKHGGIRLRHYKTVASMEWHRKGDYLSTLMPAGESRAIHIHQLSKRNTQRIPFKLHGLPVSSVFHPTRSVFFISTKKNIRAYDLLKGKLIKKLETGLREVSSIAVHPGGDNVIVGSREGKLCWFDMDLSSQPYRILHCHPKDITSVAYHRSYPLFASCSDDCSAYVFHGMVYSDLTQNPLIVPLEILRGHKSSNGRGILDCKFHPREPWLFTAGSDSVIKLYNDLRS